MKFTLVTLLVFFGAAAARDYEYIVVGAGSAGSIVAAQLAKDGADVLLLEAGGDNTDPSIDSLFQYFNVAFNTLNFGWLQWGYESTPQTLQGAGVSVTPKTIGLPRGRALGGTHSINAAAYVQAHADDFNTIATDLGDKEWQWQHTKSLRKELEHTLNITKLDETQSGASDFIDTAHEVLHLPFNADPTQGDQYGISPSFWEAQPSDAGGIRTSSFDAFVRPLLGNDAHGNQGKIDVITFHQVEYLIFDESNSTKVVGVSTINTRANLTMEFYASEEVIISGGTYNSPQILMLSGIGPQAHLDSVGIETKIDLPGVGENLRDHYSANTFWSLVDLPDETPFIFNSPMLNMFGPEPHGQTSFQFELAGNFGSAMDLRQASVGTVRLQSSDPLASPLIDPNVLNVASDIDRLVDSLEKYLLPYFQGLIDKNLLAVGNIDPSATTADIRSFVLNNVDSNHHPVGTCKIGTSNDTMAVVNKDFIVLGTSNLRVIDASVFPVVPSANTNAATMTAALLGAEKIKQARRDNPGRGDIRRG